MHPTRIASDNCALHTEPRAACILKSMSFGRVALVAGSNSTLHFRVPPYAVSVRLRF